MQKITAFLFSVMFFMVCFSVKASNEKGNLIIQSYAPDEYNAHAQNFSITQDNRGIIYVANNRGILEYDGSQWRLIEDENILKVNVVDSDENGRVFFGSPGNLGYLRVADQGKLKFQSIKSLLPDSLQQFKDILDVHCHKGKVYFLSSSFLAVWDQDHFTHIHAFPDDGFRGAFLSNDTLFVQKTSYGVFYVAGEELYETKFSKFFGDRKINSISHFLGRTVVSTFDDGFYMFKNGEIDGLVKVNAAANSVTTDNYLLLGSFTHGLTIVDSTFSPLFEIGITEGLEDESINDQFVDKDGNLWLAMNRGIAKIEIETPTTLFNYKNGIKGSVEAIIRHKGVLYAATINGVYYLDGHFKQVEELDFDCYSLENFITEDDTLLLVGAVDGVYEIKDNRAVLIQKMAPWQIQQSKINRNRLIVGDYFGLYSLRRESGKWIDEGQVYESEVHNFVEMEDGTLLLGATTNGVLKTHSAIFEDSTVTINAVDTVFGLASSPPYTALHKDYALLGNEHGLVDYQGKVRQSDVGLPPDLGVHRVSSDRKGRIWISGFYPDNTYEIMYQKEGDWYKKPFKRYNKEIVQTIFHDDNDVTFLGSSLGLIRYEERLDKNYEIPYQVLIRSVSASDSIVFHGVFQYEDSVKALHQTNDFILDYAANNLIVDFAANTYWEEHATRYRYELIGPNPGKSDWSTSTRAIFTNLHEGEYTFKVKARNIFDVESEVEEFTFTILAPWYRTMWAYIGYGIFFIAFVWGAITVSTNSLRKVIKERTAEVVAQKERIEAQKEIVEEKNKEILDSINYAKRLQEAIMPSQNVWKAHLPESFVYYVPKDIIAGDFYFMEVVEDQGKKLVYYVAADCTGHGVPGAMVSVVGANGLKRCIKEFGLRDPGKILDKLTEIVAENFAQSEERIRDGMDLALCCLDMKDMKLQFAGANNPVWIINPNRKDWGAVGNPFRTGDGIEQKADKQAIGYSEELEPFTTHVIELEKGDTIYTFSDGYPDQFGGPKNKKFKSANFKKMLISLYDEPMDKQKEVIDAEFQKWRGDYEQVDDVCVIGVRV